MYDKEFRIHLSNYPQRSWSVILQQAWSMCLQDRIQGHNEEYCRSGSNSSKKSKKEPCCRFNKGLCTAGASCKYDHCCTVLTCGKWGHGAHICRKRQEVNSPEGGMGNAVHATVPQPTTSAK